MDKRTLNALSLTPSATRVGRLSRDAGEALSRGSWGGLARLGPAFGKGEGAGAEGTPLAFQRPGLAFGFDAVARETRAERRDQQGADAIFAAALARVRVNEQRLADLIGPVAGRLHTARSRNDQVALDFKLWVRDTIDAIDAQLADL